MKPTFSKHPWFYGGFAAASVTVFCSLAVHPSGSVKRPELERSSHANLQFPPQVTSILNRSCMDCHSNRTVWRWYSYVAPVSWLVERDVSEGRNHMNFSEWDRYTFKQRRELLADIASVLQNHEMPVPQYTLIHRDAKLSDADTDLLYAWARAERRKLKASVPVVPTGESHTAKAP